MFCWYVSCRIGHQDPNRKGVLPGPEMKTRMEAKKLDNGLEGIDN